MPRLIMSNRNLFRTLDVRPDDADARDYIFRPSLALLPEMFDNRGCSKVLDQKAEGACVGFALAALINISLNRRAGNNSPKCEVSPRMLYEMGKRYDEWDGEYYEGTSLRGAMKGWHKHGVTTEELWPYLNKNGEVIKDFAFTRERAEDALKRPLGAYYRVDDNDVSLIQAAVVEGEAVLASAWVHSGWEEENLKKHERHLNLNRIPTKTGRKGIHAFAIVGYTPDGFIIQNSWGEEWGSDGYALLGYDDWFENRQDAWVARPGPVTRDSKGKAKIFISTGFSGDFDDVRTGSTISGLNLDSRLHDFLINTGDKGLLSDDGRLITKEDDLPQMAEKVLDTPEINGYRHVILFAHGGLVSEKGAAKAANSLFRKCQDKGLGTYFFIWESGLMESFFGWLESTGASGPVGFSFIEAWEWFKQKADETWEKTQELIGKGLALPLRVLWREMLERAEGASGNDGGASLFIKKLFDVISKASDTKYKIHLVSHSAGSIFLGYLYETMLKDLLSTAGNHIKFASIQFLAPSITIEDARRKFQGAVKNKENFVVYSLKPEHEASEIVGISPHSVLTYVSKHIVEDSPLLGIKEHFEDERASEFATLKEATESVTHWEFLDDGHEIEQILDDIANDKF